MKSVADDLRAERDLAFRALSPDERVRHVLALGRAAIRLYAEANGVDEAEAAAILRRINQRGRRPCSFL